MTGKIVRQTDKNIAALLGKDGLWSKLAAAVNRFDPDVVVLVARKMPRLLDVMPLELDNNVVYISDQAIPFAYKTLENARVAIVDDLLNIGTTLNNAVRRVEACQPASVRAFVLGARDWKDAKKSKTFTVVRGSLNDQVYESFVNLIPQILLKAPKPFDADFPILECTLAMPYSNWNECRNWLQHRFGDRVHFLSEDWQLEIGFPRAAITLDHSHGWIIKTRLYFDFNNSVCNVVPMALAPVLPLKNDYPADTPSHKAFDALVNSLKNGNCKDSNYGALARANTFCDALMSANIVLEALDGLLVKNNPEPFSRDDFLVQFGNAATQACLLALSDANFDCSRSDLYSFLEKRNALDMAAKKNDELIYNSSISEQAITFFQKDLPELGMQALFSNLAKVTGADDPGRYDLTVPYSREEIKKSPYLRLRIGLTYKQISKLIGQHLNLKSIGDKQIEYVVSALMDTFIDVGACVPTSMLLPGGNACVRAYRKGESNPQWDKGFSYIHYALDALGKEEKKKIIEKGERTRVSKIIGILAITGHAPKQFSIGALERGNASILANSVVEPESGESTGLMRKLGMWSMAKTSDQTPNSVDEIDEAKIKFGRDFKDLYYFIHDFSEPGKVTLFLSTCRNAYFTLNALFVDIQFLLSGDRKTNPPIRHGCELLIKGYKSDNAKSHFERARRTTEEYNRKKSVWESREQIFRDIESRKEKISISDPSRAHSIHVLINKADGASLERQGGWHSHLLKIDTTERPSLNDKFKELDTVLKILDLVTNLGLKASVIAPVISNDNTQATLPLEHPADSVDIKAIEAILEIIKQAAKACAWECDDQESELIIRPVTSHIRSQKNPKFSFSKPAESTDITEFTRHIGSFICETLYYVHSRLCNTFDPNTADLPMPDFFRIKLTPPSDFLVVATENHSIKLQHVRCAPQDDRRTDKARLALAALAVPCAELKGRDLAFEKKTAEKIEEDIDRAIQKAVDEQCSAILFPEYSVPYSISDKKLLQLANDKKIVIVGGLEGCWNKGEFCNKAVIAIPGESRIHYQCKQQPSLEEESKEHFYKDGVIRLFSNSPIGNFSVIVCSDLMELDTLQVWKPKGRLPELLLVVTRNQHHDLFQPMAISDSIRLYAGVAIANVNDDDSKTTTNANVNADSKGSCVAMPMRDNPLLDKAPISLDGHYLSGIDIYDINLNGIRGRNRGKPEKGFIRPPHAVKS